MEGTTTLAVPSSTVWRELATGREYGAIVGGLAWPCHPHEGALVVLGLEWDGLRPVAHGADPPGMHRTIPSPKRPGLTKEENNARFDRNDAQPGGRPGHA